MSNVRQDAWTNDEDLVLAEVVLRHIREGSTQLAAFEEVGSRLTRTAAACGFRWNSAIRKEYEAAIAIAKKQRKNLKKAKPNQIQEKKEEHTAPIQTDLRAISLDDVLSFLATQKDVAAENIELKQKVESLVEKNKELEETLSELKAKYQVIKTDYQLMMDIMNRAKQLTV
ncbi:MAG: RsfA family transcriptional regulator [Bacillaceae bacterium]|nr:RsfA family transcriptional regulator [Bacillaceae bacterium]